ncbi:acetyl esterase [Nocardioides ginsengisegetis]|uniref:Acetyl esterase n=1 Tax=Nocardioides ginsengisegetis TaxID=661491 RepID=A0A7W3PBL5_9ACTN|nr:acetyl esterase [Nocardioides ginsengisegetis]
MRIDDAVRAGLMHALARFTVRYGDELRFAGEDLPKPEKVRVPTRYGHVPVHLYRPVRAARRALGAYVHFHGGAFLMRYPQMDDFWCRYVASRAGVVVANVDFRAGPYVRYPVAQHEAHDAAAHLATRGSDHGIDGTRVAVGGLSSGGALAAATCLQARDRGSFAPVLQVLGVPALDMATAVDTGAPGMISPALRRLVRRVYFPDPATRADPYASPLLTDTVRGLPPAVVLTAERDTLRPDGDKYAARLRNAGIEVVSDMTPGADHYFLSHDLDRARRTMEMVAGQIRRRTSPA